MSVAAPKALIAGSRSWTNYEAVLRQVKELPKDTIVITGGAIGADQLGMQAAESCGLTTHTFYPNWEKYGKRAGFVRNIEMLDENPDVVLIFWDGISRGTKHTLDNAKKRGMNVRRITSKT